jgi:hypothetical protein
MEMGGKIKWKAIVTPNCNLERSSASIKSFFKLIKIFGLFTDTVVPALKLIINIISDTFPV